MYAILTSLSVAQTGEPAANAKDKPPPSQGARPGPISQEERCTALQLTSRWLGVELNDDQVLAVESVTTTDGRWAFSSLTTKWEPAWQVDLAHVSFQLAPTRKTRAFDLRVLVRRYDGALLGVRSHWPHEALGIRVEPLPERIYQEWLQGRSECWLGPASDSMSTLQEVLVHISKGMGGPSSAEYLAAYAVERIDVPTGGANICVGREKGTMWSVELACLAGKRSMALGMDLRGTNAARIVSHLRHTIIDNPLSGGGASTSPPPVVTITTADGAVEERNWHDSKHPPPHGIAKKGEPESHQAK